VFTRILEKAVKNGFNRGPWHAFQAGHCVADFLHFAWAKVFEYFGGQILA
jgi:hypothetical protein